MRTTKKNRRHARRTGASISAYPINPANGGLRRFRAEQQRMLSEQLAASRPAPSASMISQPCDDHLDTDRLYAIRFRGSRVTTAERQHAASCSSCRTRLANAEAYAY